MNELLTIDEIVRDVVTCTLIIYSAVLSSFVISSIILKLIRMAKLRGIDGGGKF